MHEAEEEMGVVFVACDESPEVLQPTDRAFDLPATTIAGKLAPVLKGRARAIVAMRADQFDAALSQPLPQMVAVGGEIVDQVLGKSSQATLIEKGFDQLDIVRTGAGDEDAQRQARGVGEDHDLGPFTTFGFADALAPFFADANVPSAIAWSRSIWPVRSRRCSSRDQARSHAPRLVQASNRRQHVLGEGKQDGKSFQRAPVRSTQQIPSKHSRDSAGGRPPSGERGNSGNRSAIRDHCSSSSSNVGSVVDPAGASAAPLSRDRAISDLLSTLTDTQQTPNGLASKSRF